MFTKQHIHTVTGKLVTYWVPEARVLLGEWSDYFLPLTEFSNALDFAVQYAKQHGGIGWIVDSHKAKGTFPQAIQEQVPVFYDNFMKNGLRYFITINAESMLTKLTVDKYRSQAGPSGITLLEMASVDDAVEWLKLNVLK